MKGQVSQDDARRLARYLIGEDPTGDEARRWIAAVGARGAILRTRAEHRLWDTIMRRPFLIGAADAGLAWTDPLSPVRHRILLMLAILEASPHHHRHFLAAPWTVLTPMALGLRGLRAGARLLAGVIWMKAAGTTPR